MPTRPDTSIGEPSLFASISLQSDIANAKTLLCEFNRSIGHLINRPIKTCVRIVISDFGDFHFRLVFLRTADHAITCHILIFPLFYVINLVP